MIRNTLSLSFLSHGASDLAVPATHSRGGKAHNLSSKIKIGAWLYPSQVIPCTRNLFNRNSACGLCYRFCKRSLRAVQFIREHLMSYVAPLKDMLFVINELAGLSEVNALPGC
ncbi:acyl-CoA dehydrogenase N-terminal domain-containing protein, partial [Noviherbaspirillum autotrophicum]|uniref:acyl-CoA dehydrogenase N-terminal domain-containing protein n=1 Tax=Noviherbaspirillum autotrophicum TaxID=709839 RepID=UPI0018DFEEC2